MRLTKWLFFVYLAGLGLLAALLGTSLALVPPRDPQTLYTAYGSNVRTLDPAEISDTTSSAIAGNIFECLYNYDYYARPYRLFAELAADLPQISADTLTYTIRLRRGIHFHDPDRVVFPKGRGPELRAQDVIYSLKRIANFHLASPNAAFIAGKIKGIDDWTKYTQQTSPAQIDWDRPVEGLTATDDYTLQITLAEPYPQLVYVLAHLPTAPVSRAAVKYYGDRFREHPIGTGAYTLRHRDHQKQQRIVLTANPDYRGRPDVDGFAAVDAAQRQPHIRRLQIDFFKADLPPWFLFRQGLLDISAIPKDTFSQAVRQGGELTAAMQRQGIKLVKAPDPTTYYIGFNMLDAVLGRNKPLRQAMSMAINRQRFISVYRNGRGELPIGPIPPGFESFDPQEANPYARFDPQAARDLLAKAQQIHGGPLPKLSLLMSGTDTEDRQMGDFLRSQWEAMGLRIEVDYTDWARFLDIVERRRTAQLFFLAWQADYPDEQNFFQLFYGKNIREGGQNNTAWKNEAFDRLYEQASVLPPGPPRTAVYKQMSRLVMDECPWALLYYPSSYVLHHGWVDNLLLSDYLHGARQHLKLDSSARSAWLSRNR